MLTECPNCTWSDEVEDEFLGQQAECPSCENDFIVAVKEVIAPAKKQNKLRVANRPKTRVPSRTKARDAGQNPYAAPSSSTAPRRRSTTAAKTYPGIHRLPYFGLSLLFNALSLIPIAGIIIGLIGGMYIAVQRLKNVGYHPLFCLFLFVPIANLWISFICIGAPEGYADHKTLDTAGKTILGIMIGLFLLSCIAIALVFMNIR